ncbi:hypothetical protein [Arthrobacter sp. SLBN-100]|uniref:hypothetical protein n=1 Tax=Arthrobacter sp. SLBN-100 TaxID=2768450 RepID=UPI00114D6C71|nr:hypothetical protein [Arthrobacter sp. SLBN-100]
MIEPARDHPVNEDYAHTMKPRGVFLLAIAVIATAGAFAGMLGSVPRACPAIGYAYVGDVELSFSIPPASVAACMGEGCIPEQVRKNPEGKWLVPQSPPYLYPPVSVTSIHVEALATAGDHIARTLPIETESTGEHPFGTGCGGPFKFKPVQVSFS